MAENRTFYRITNRFMFGRIFSDPDNARPLLEAVLGVPIGEIHYVDEEHTVEPSLMGKGVRMDVFVDDGTGTVYDVEMQNVDEKNLALRSRYLLSSFDRDRIERGEDYMKLGESIVIFVCIFDPLGKGERVYAVRPMEEHFHEPFDDGTLRVFLNAEGAAEGVEEVASVSGEEVQPAGRLGAFLTYVDGGGTMGDEWVKKLDDEVHELNNSPGWRDAMLSYQLILQDERRIARKEGHDEGYAEGHDEGYAEGCAEGRAEGREEGRAEGREEGRAEGREEGRAEGRDEVLKEEADVNRRLVMALREAGREGELADALLDPLVKARLLEEFAIASNGASGA